MIEYQSCWHKVSSGPAAAVGLPPLVRRRRVVDDVGVGELSRRRVAPATVTAAEVAGVSDDGFSVSDSTDI